MNRNSTKHNDRAGWWGAVAMALLPLLALGADLTPAQVEFFENKVRPVLAESCYKCHSVNSEKLKGGLLLDSREGVLKGGNSGPAIVPKPCATPIPIWRCRRKAGSSRRSRLPTLKPG